MDTLTMSLIMVIVALTCYITYLLYRLHEEKENNKEPEPMTSEEVEELVKITSEINESPIVEWIRLQGQDHKHIFVREDGSKIEINIPPGTKIIEPEHPNEEKIREALHLPKADKLYQAKAQKRMRKSLKLP